MKRASLTRRTARIAVALAALTTVLWAGPVRANSPDPIFGGALFATDQALAYSWGTTVPDVWMQNGINAGAANSNKLTLATTLQGTKVATFAYEAGGTSKISKSTSNCDPSNPLAIACMTRTAPTSFTVKLNSDGMALQGFTLKWCSWYAAQNPPKTEPASGCFDVANVTLDELGHVLVLNHHNTALNESDYSDAVVQAHSHAKLNVGWNAAQYGRCDVASLQAQYGMKTSSKLYSTCLTPRVAPTLSFNASSTSVPMNTVVTFASTLTTGNWPGDFGDRISLKPAHARTVYLQRAAIGSSSFSNFVAMSPGTTAGTYAASVATTGDYQWRVNFPQPSNEGFLAARTSGVLTVNCTNC